MPDYAHDLLWMEYIALVKSKSDQGANEKNSIQDIYHHDSSPCTLDSPLLAHTTLAFESL